MAAENLGLLQDIESGIVSDEESDGERISRYTETGHEAHAVALYYSAFKGKRLSSITIILIHNMWKVQKLFLARLCDHLANGKPRPLFTGSICDRDPPVRDVMYDIDFAISHLIKQLLENWAWTFGLIVIYIVFFIALCVLFPGWGFYYLLMRIL